jgi:hypothetical protein
VAVENDDFAVFRNPTARPYVSAYADACLFAGDVRASPRLALELSARRMPLVHAEAHVAALSTDELRRYARVYVHGEPPPALAHLPPDLSARITPMGADAVVIPARPGRTVALEDVRLERPRNGTIRVGLRAPVACLVVIAESYYPFWRAAVDGTAVAVRRVSSGLMGIDVTPGEHDIVLRYVPPRAYAWAAGVSGLGWLACLGLLIRRRGVRHRGEDAAYG